MVPSTHASRLMIYFLLRQHIIQKQRKVLRWFTRPKVSSTPALSHVFWGPVPT